MKILHRPALWALTATLACTAAQAELQARDVDRDGAIDAYYDTALHVTWYGVVMPRADWTYAYITAHDNEMLGVGGWRMPTMIDVGNDGCTINVDCGPMPWTQVNGVVYSELAHLWYETLGNSPGVAPINTGPFGDWTGRMQWTDVPYTLQPDSFAWAFDTFTGEQVPWNMNDSIVQHMLVHDGDLLAPVPEPAAGWLGLAGGLALLGWRRCCGRGGV